MSIHNRQEELSLRILHNCRNELCDIYPYLDGAFACLGYRSQEERGFAIDGENLYFSPSDLLRLYGKEPARVRRGYMHVLLHCLYLHIFRPSDVEPGLWNLACDMAVEQLIEEQNHEENDFYIPGNDREKGPFGKTDSVITDCLAILGPTPLAAEQIVRLLQDVAFPYSLEEMQAAFHFDDHDSWEKAPGEGVRRKWQKAFAYASGNKQGSGKRRGSVSGMMEEEVMPVDRSKLDYRKYLHKFTVPREEMELDDDSFDYIYYNLGMENYGSMPLIEPLEYKEVHRLDELVIAIDTSGSCSKEVVGQFLAETYQILSQRENFFRKMNVYFIQCDCLIQDVVRIRSREEWLEYVKKVKIQGRGGTDFRPVFNYIQKLREEKKLKQFKALIYFTDGDGIYPTVTPNHDTLFVLLKDSGRPDLLPGWARKLYV